MVNCTLRMSYSVECTRIFQGHWISILCEQFYSVLSTFCRLNIAYKGGKENSVMSKKNLLLPCTVYVNLAEYNVSMLSS